jgi:protein gp37
MGRSPIEWTEETWNPITGCDRVSPGCDHCYAERLSTRLRAMGSSRYANGFELTLHWDKLDEPLRWQRPRLVFVNSMSDLFHPGAPREFIDRAFAIMAEAALHTFQILTKRPQRAADLLRGRRLPRNVWLGTSIELDAYVYRADHLREVAAPVRFLSCEPLLGPLPSLRLDGIGWVIAGGESGPGHRPLDPSWAIDLRDRCADAGIPFFFKQWGGNTPKARGRQLEGRTWDGMPQGVASATLELQGIRR